MLAEDRLNLNRVFSDIWDYLSEGAERSKSDFHLASLGTTSANQPRLRTVVLRRVIPEEHSIVFHTDSRSAKFKEINANHNVSLLFYSKEKKVQIRLEGKASLHTDDDLAEKQ